MKSLNAFIPGTALLVALALSACSSPAAPSSPSSSAGIDSDQATAIAELFSSASSDYIAAATPAELGSKSDVVIKGTILRVQEGRVDGDPADQITDAKSIVVVISKPKIISGELPAGSDGLVYVELQSPFNQSAADYERGLPKNTKVVVYLVAASDGTDTFSQLQDPAAGRPAGQPLYMPYNPQSFAVELIDKSGVTWIGEPTQAQKVKLDDTLPSGTVIPTP